MMYINFPDTMLLFLMLIAQFSVGSFHFSPFSEITIHVQLNFHSSPRAIKTQLIAQLIANFI